MTALLDVMAVRATGDPGLPWWSAALPDPASRRRGATCSWWAGAREESPRPSPPRARDAACASSRRRTGSAVSSPPRASPRWTSTSTSSASGNAKLLRPARGHPRSLPPPVPALAAAPHANPGRCWVTRLAFEPRVAVDALHAMAQPFVESGRLAILTRTKAASAQVGADRVESVLAVNLDDRRWTRFRRGHRDRRDGAGRSPPSGGRGVRRRRGEHGRHGRAARPAIRAQATLRPEPHLHLRARAHGAGPSVT